MTRPLEHASDYTFQATRPSVTSHLKNGGFFSYRGFTAINFSNNNRFTEVFRTEYTHRVSDSTPGNPSTAVPVTIPGFSVTPEIPKENTLGYWDVWGVSARVLLNETRKSLDGGNLVTVRFTAAGDVTFKQTIESLNKFRGKPVSLALTGSGETGDVRVVLKISTGSALLEGRPFYSSRFGRYYRMTSDFTLPLDISKMEVLIVLTGKAGTSVAFSGAVLCLGAYYGDIPFSESLPDISVPPGTIIGYVGENCPAGYRSLGEGVYLHQVLGDPNAVRGNLYTGSTQGAGTLDSMGPRGALELGDNSHRHDSETSSPGRVVYGKAFAGGGATNVKVDADESYVYNNFWIHQTEHPLNRILTVHAGGHANRFVMKEEEVEPPRIKMRLCEKI